MISERREARIERALQAFEGKRTDQHRREIIDLLEHDEGVRKATLQKLERYADDPGYVEPLLPALTARATDPNPDVRNAVRAVLGRHAEACVANDQPLSGLTDRLTHDDTDVRRDALTAAKMLSEHRPAVLAEELPTFTDLLSDPDSEVRYLAATLLGYLADVRPDDVSAVVPELEARLETDDVLVQNGVVQAVRNISGNRPGSLVEAMPAIRSVFETGTVELDPAVETLANVAAVAPDSVSDVTAELVEVATTSGNRGQANREPTSSRTARANDARLRRETARVDALRALGSIAEHDPDGIVPRIEEIAPLLTADVPAVRERARAVVRLLGIERPETMETTVPALLEGLTVTSAESERREIQQVLIDFSETSPATFARGLERRVDLLVDSLAHDDEDLRGAAAGYLSYVAERDPTAVPVTEETLLQLLEDENPVVRGNAALVLGPCGSEDAKDALTALDPDEAFVAEAVEQALARLE